MEREHVKVTTINRCSGEKDEKRYLITAGSTFGMEDAEDNEKYAKELADINNFVAGNYFMQGKQYNYSVQVVRNGITSALRANHLVNAKSPNNDNRIVGLPPAPERKMYHLISYVWRNEIGALTHANDVTDLHPAEWLSDVNHRFKNRAILINHLPISEQQYHELKDFM